jgi:hypothetical protein
LLVLPNIDAANISYNLLKQAAGGGIAIGPVLARRGQAGAHPDAVGDGAPHRQHDGADGGRRQPRALTRLSPLHNAALCAARQPALAYSKPLRCGAISGEFRWSCAQTPEAFSIGR